ncbi:hypothetical protein J1C56_02285 [Aminobacter anthyllidis]|uniref:Uncharacterized protein n=1 Tax=Aminobacter anthyllidis TaxID=1035067 RepID=A0A9X1D494_9HYPH|nr:hypothetical protein [Aminobacter anthyllidis]MBT1154413.1 hypothetical protein [Aminobacter anthyllidis]
MSSATKDLMELLHGTVAQELLDRIKAGDATAADFSNAIKFLKDNGIEAQMSKNPGVTSLAEQFPSFTDDDEHVAH